VENCWELFCESWLPNAKSSGASESYRGRAQVPIGQRGRFEESRDRLSDALAASNADRLSYDGWTSVNAWSSAASEPNRRGGAATIPKIVLNNNDAC
jgi:hypothetical protein